MATEPTVTLEFALVATALAVGIVIWVFARLAHEYRQMNRRRQAVRERLTDKEIDLWESLQTTLGLLRDRANAWSTQNYYESRRALEAIDAFEVRALENPDQLREAAEHARSVLSDFDDEPDAARLQVIEEGLESSHMRS